MLSLNDQGARVLYLANRSEAVQVYYDLLVPTVNCFTLDRDQLLQRETGQHHEGIGSVYRKALCNFGEAGLESEMT
jgi:hypothetical protein